MSTEKRAHGILEVTDRDGAKVTICNEANNTRVHDAKVYVKVVSGTDGVYLTEHDVRELIEHLRPVVEKVPRRLVRDEKGIPPLLPTELMVERLRALGEEYEQAFREVYAGKPNRLPEVAHQLWCAIPVVATRLSELRRQVDRSGDKLTELRAAKDADGVAVSLLRDIRAKADSALASLGAQGTFAPTKTEILLEGGTPVVASFRGYEMPGKVEGVETRRGLPPLYDIALDDTWDVERSFGQGVMQVTRLKVYRDSLKVVGDRCPETGMNPCPWHPDGGEHPVVAE